MSTFNLPETYARVVAKRPDLAVKYPSAHTNELLRHCQDGWGWYQPDRYEWSSDDYMPEHLAAALILARWVEALPQYTWLGHDGDPLNGWKVRGLKDGDNYEIIIVMVDAKPTPLEAIAAFYLGETA